MLLEKTKADHKISIFCNLNFRFHQKDLCWSMIVREVEETTKEDRIWFNGVLDKRTGEVIFANIGRTPELQKDSGLSKKTS